MATMSYTTVALLFLGVTSSFACKVPPQFWCDSLHIATECGVKEQCEAFQQSNNQLVNVGLYYESMCPGCKYFIQTQLTPAFKTIGSILNITLVPYGNAKTHFNSYLPGGHWFECQHGPEECVGNMIETCAIHFYPKVSDHFPFISCVESSTIVPRLAGPKCASDHKINYTKISHCIDHNNPLGVDLEVDMGDRTNALKPPHQFVPWITLNGAHTDEIQSSAQKDLIGLVCKTYTGIPKPQACSKPNKPHWVSSRL